MPILSHPRTPRHRDHIASINFPFSLIAEPVTRAQRRANPKAQAACDLEWSKLQDRGTWDPGTVTEWRIIADRSRRSGTKVHVAKICELCVVKGAELHDDDPNKKFKGRAVLDGS